jgi:hypothetical protein
LEAFAFGRLPFDSPGANAFLHIKYTLIIQDFSAEKAEHLVVCPQPNGLKVLDVDDGLLVLRKTVKLFVVAYFLGIKALVYISAPNGFLIAFLKVAAHTEISVGESKNCFVFNRACSLRPHSLMIHLDCRICYSFTAPETSPEMIFL